MRAGAVRWRAVSSCPPQFHHATHLRFVQPSLEYEAKIMTSFLPHILAS